MYGLMVRKSKVAMIFTGRRPILGKTYLPRKLNSRGDSTTQ